MIGLPESVQILISGSAEKVSHRYGIKLFEAGVEDDIDYFLLEGEVLLTNADGMETVINPQADMAKGPLSVLRPRQLSARVKSHKAILYTLPHSVMEMICEESRKEMTRIPILEAVIGDKPKSTVLHRVQKEIIKGNLSLVTLPKVAMMVKKACQDPESDLQGIAKIINRDPSMAVKIIRAANTPMYRGTDEVKTITDATSRLGKKLIQHLVFYFATKELFQTSNKQLELAFRQVWHSALERAVMAQAVARLSHSHFDPDIAFLAGLLFRIGDLLFLQYMNKNIDDQKELKKVVEITEQESAASSYLAVSQWGLPEIITDVLKEGGSWDYNSSASSANYTDLIIATNVVLRLKNKDMSDLPAFENMPSVAKIMHKDFAKSVRVMDEYRKGVAAFKAL